MEIKFKAYIKSLGWVVDVERINFDCKTIEVDLSAGQGDTTEYDFDEVELLQYTGVKDRKGREVYEGDIVKANDNGRDLICEVIYERAMFLLKWGKSSCFYYGLCTYELEVIGNIYKNPELIKEEK